MMKMIGGRMARFTYQEDVYAGGSNDPHYSWNARHIGMKTKLQKWVSWAIVLLCAITVTALAVSYISVCYYDMYKSSGAQYDLARAAPNADVIAYYLGRIDDGLVQQDATSGYAAAIFKSDANDLGIYRAQLGNLRERAAYVATLAHRTVAYQYALTNLRSAVNNLGTVDNALLWARLWWAWAVVIIAATITLVAGINMCLSVLDW
jgi:hypothetical protein